MKSVGTLRKKGLGGVDHYMKKDKSKNSGSSSPASAGTSSHPSPKSIVTAVPAPTKPVQQAPITVDLHRFADDNLQPEDCKHTHVYITSK
jgi:hypothetical protein